MKSWFYEYCLRLRWRGWALLICHLICHATCHADMSSDMSWQHALLICHLICHVGINSNLYSSPRGWITKFEFLPSHLNVLRLWPLIVVDCTCHVVLLLFLLVVAFFNVITVVCSFVCLLAGVYTAFWRHAASFNNIIFVGLLGSVQRQFACLFLLAASFFTFVFSLLAVAFFSMLLLLFACLLACRHTYSNLNGMRHRSIT